MPWARCARSVATIAGNEDDAAMSAQGIAVLHGRATFTAPQVVDVDGTVIRARRTVVATGAEPMIPPIDGLDSIDFLTNETLFDLDRRPASMAVLGGGPIGVEMAQAFARLGTRITVVEAEDRVLPREERDASAIIARALEADGVQVRVGARLERVEPTSAGAVLHLSSGDPIRSSGCWWPSGDVPSPAASGLAEIGVRLDERGFVRTDDTMRTNVAGVWAVGDVTGRLQFTHAAARMGLVAADNALSRVARIRPKRFSTAGVPWVTFTDPEVGHVGMTEAEAAEHGGVVATVPFDAFDRAITAGRTDGYATLIAGPRRVLRNVGGGRILGATVVGPAGELVNEVALAIQTRMFAGRLAQTVHAYPTWSMARPGRGRPALLRGRRARPPTRSLLIRAASPWCAEVAQRVLDATVECRVGVDHLPQALDGDVGVHGEGEQAEHLATVRVRRRWRRQARRGRRPRRAR